MQKIKRQPKIEKTIIEAVQKWGMIMDFTDGMQQASLPLGLSFGLAADKNALDNYSNLTEYEKEQLIAQSKSVKSKDEMQQLIQQISDGESMM